jgi:hypothetical protein
MRYVHRPTQVDAIQASEVLAAWPKAWKTMPEWVHKAQLILNADKGTIIVNTLHGTVVANKTDWLLRAVTTGDVWPARDDVFREGYALIPEPP